MSIIAKILIALVALEHIYILVLEMFLWTTPRGRKAFGTTPEFAEQSKVLAANQGLYNGFLAAGLIWSLGAAPSLDVRLAVLFGGCVLVAGVFGALTIKPINRGLLLAQALPALLALISIWLR